MDDRSQHASQGDAPAAPAFRGWLQLGVIAAQLALLILVVRAYSIEGAAFHRLLALTWAGFLVHHLAPARFRMPFFLALSLGAIAMVFGMGQGGWNPSDALLRTGCLVAIGLVLLAICHLPLSLGKRVGLLAVAGAVLAWLRSAYATSPELAVVWPVVGSMFMFRLIVYLYELQHEKGPRSVSRSLSYFFLLPNICFPLFPVVDYKTFAGSSVPDAARIAVYQKGIGWMLRGIVQLIAYRFLDQHVLMQPADVVSGGDVVPFLVANVLMYLRVSGYFHLVIGLLHLFGFDLPETNRRYFLASSFTDYWRRVNIYWKDFILKIFYYPAYFRVKHWGPTRALVAATVFSFFMTWLLHAYQWFWLRGDFLLSWQDVTFWSVLGALVVANSLWELRRGRRRTLRRPAWSWRASGARALRTAGTFTVVTVLWSLWASTSFAEWFGLWRVVDATTLLHAGWVLGGIALAAVAEDAFSGRKPPARSARAAGSAGALRPLPQGSLACAATALVVYALGMPALQSRLDPSVAPFAEALAGTQPRDAQDADANRRYYEALMNADEFNPRLWEAYTGRAAEGGDGISLARPTQDFRLAELTPSSQSRFQDVLITTNRWGMRDGEYEQAKAPGTFRIAVLGSSHAMGFGVSGSEVFEDQVERRLNRDRPGGPNVRYEVLNFAVSGYSPLAQLAALDRIVASFEPDLVLVIGHSVDPSWTTDHLVKALKVPGGLPYDDLEQLTSELGLDAHSLRIWAKSRLKPREPELLAWAYRELAERSRAMGALPVYAFVSTPRENASKERILELLETARRGGFVVVDLSEVYRGVRPEELVLTEWNLHPNARAHGMIADALHHALLSDPQIGLAARSAQREGVSQLAPR